MALRHLVGDASVLIDLSRRVDSGGAIRGALLHAPELVLIEAASALRRDVRLHAVDAGQAGRWLDKLSGSGIRLHPHRELLSRVWVLRNNFSAYDASYVALAERLQVPLATKDIRLAHAASALVEVIVPD